MLVYQYVEFLNMLKYVSRARILQELASENWEFNLIKLNAGVMICYLKSYILFLSKSID